jgi:hypothetical protein
VNNFEDLIHWMSIAQSLTNAGWRIKIYTKDHPLGIVPCIEFSKEFDGKCEFHTFYSEEELEEWLREPCD